MERKRDFVQSIIRSFIVLAFVFIILAGCVEDSTTVPTNNGETVISGQSEAANDFENNVVQATQYGKIKGYVDDAKETLIWKGIPYGEAPKGELRWRVPKEPVAWGDVFDATKPGEAAIQINQGDVTGGDPPLNLDIFRPNTNEADLPVFSIFMEGIIKLKIVVS